MRTRMPAIFGVVVFTLATAPVRGEIVDEIVATVDNEVILYSELLAEARPALEQLRATESSQESFNRQAEDILRDTLEQAVESKVLLREARLLGVTVEDDAVERRIDNLKGSGETTEEFLRELQESGETIADVRERLRKMMLAQKLSASKMNQLESQVVVSEAEIADYYEEHKDEYSKPERVQVRQIFLAADTEAERAKARARLEALKDELETGASFEDLAEAHSEAPGAENGGMFGWQRRGDLIPVLEDVVFNLEEGQVSDVLESPGGVHLMKVEQHEEAGVAPLEEVQSEIEPILRQQAAQERYNLWIDELRKRSRVRIFF